MKLMQVINNITWKVIFFYALTMVIIFSLAYYFIGLIDPANGLSTGQADLLTAFYFSIVTFSSLGYGDIVPVGYGRIIAMLEVILGLLFIGTLVSKLVSMRQELLLSRLYHLEYISHFRSIRGEFNSQRRVIENTSLKLFYDPDDKEHLSEVNSTFKGRSSIFRQIISSLSGLLSFLEAEKEREEPVMKKLNVYHFTRVLSSLQLNLLSLDTALDRFRQIKYNDWKTKTVKNDIDEIAKLSGQVMSVIAQEQKSDEIKALRLEIKKILQGLKKKAV